MRIPGLHVFMTTEMHTLWRKN